MKLIDPYAIGLIMNNPNKLINRCIENAAKDQHNIYVDMQKNEIKSGVRPNIYLPIDTYIPCEYFIDTDRFYGKHNFLEHLIVKTGSDNRYMETSETPLGQNVYYFNSEFFDILKYVVDVHLLL